MSEYQYYEFLAIDRPLSTEEMSALRTLSTRAHITPVSFTNEYQWGNFRGNPVDLMKRFFDAHVYVANWMTAIFMIRLPTEALQEKTAEVIAVNGILDLDATKTHWIITWSLDESENYDRFGMEDGRGWMARLAPIRDELLRGDIRSLYIGWLAGVTREIVDDSTLEPLEVEGLGNLTAAQQALAQFLEVDENLLAGAGIGSPALRAEEPSHKEIDGWLDKLPRDEVLNFMKQILGDQRMNAERTLKNRFSAWKRSLSGDGGSAPRRSVGELKKNAEMAKKRRLEREKREQEQLTAKRRKEREAFLATLANDFPKAWKVVQQQVERGLGPAYDEACRTLVDISEAYALHADRDTFSQELKRFMASHLRRKTFVRRIKKAGIWHDK